MTNRILAVVLSIMAYFLFMVSGGEKTSENVSSPSKLSKKKISTKPIKKSVNQNYLAASTGTSSDAASAAAKQAAILQYQKDITSYQSSFKSQMDAYYQKIYDYITAGMNNVSKGKWSLAPVGTNLTWEDYFYQRYPTTTNVNEAILYHAENSTSYFGAKPVYNPPIYQG